VNHPELGILEWFRFNDRDRVERAIADLESLRVRRLRTGVSWADAVRPGGEEWYDWLLPRLTQAGLEVLPCFMYTPPSLAVAPRTCAPPKRPRDFADWLDTAITRWGEHFEYVELWNEPNNVCEWEWTLDPAWEIYSEMIGDAAYWSRQRGKKTVLGGMSPIDPNWLDLMGQRGVLAQIDVVGVHGFPEQWALSWDGWDAEIAKAREVLARWNLDATIWITETGHSTVRNDAWGQAEALLRAAEAPVERIYWYGIADLDPDVPSQVGFHTDEREYHFGLKDHEGRPKPLFRLWSTLGLDGLHELETAMRHPHVDGAEPVTLISGGAGFVGTNVAKRELESGRRVRLLDNMIRPGVEHNLRWLRERYRDRLDVRMGDVRDRYAVRAALEDADRAFHFAAQVAVTTSVDHPAEDFDVNLVGTFRLLEEVRRLDTPPTLLFTSTNKVYGDLGDVELRLRDDRYEPSDLVTRSRGIGEDRSLDFHSPYGCSKGAADQYVLDYSRTYDLPTTVFRMSCIYGPHQFGNEDQGWVAHFLIRALNGQPVTLYGDGKQVRDVLFVEDLVDAMLLAHARMDVTRARAFNIGGGPENTTSLLELLDLIGQLIGEPVERTFGDWRTGDQRYYVSDTSRFREATGWSPGVGVSEGVRRLRDWLQEESPIVGRKKVGHARSVTVR
jgi:CDP-paratose 2-epimerase